MNEILAELEEFEISDLCYILEYLIDLINSKKRNSVARSETSAPT